ncbi:MULTISPECIES: hypothetical protein [unclassified Caballeronia]|uniref:hypothetical protein n=1 Tax=unclassified Caballeronia TaxID=2646786 RepID=UPI001F1524D6|nr:MULTISPECIES: hypothetical protein [unclassified Caballeronia]
MLQPSTICTIRSAAIRWIVPSVAIPWGGALINNLSNLVNKDYQLAHPYNTPRRGTSIMPG